VNLREELRSLQFSAAFMLEVNLGATAIGTGVNTADGYVDVVIEKLAEISGLPVTGAHDLIEATSDNGAYVHLHAAVKRVAVKLSKISNDLRLLSSGPRAGLNEIILPAMQAGSSIMPAKVNPVVPEVVNQVCFKGHRQRRDRDHGCRSGAAAAQCHGAHAGSVAVRVTSAEHQRVPGPDLSLCAGHHREC